MKMMRIYRWQFCLFMAVLSGFSLQSIAQQLTGRLSGTVILVTGEPVSNLELELRVFQPEQPISKQQAVSESDGSFLFTNLDRNPEKGYGVYALYQGAEYYSPLFRFEDDAQEISFELSVYESTTSDEHISVTQHDIQIDSEEGGLRITEKLVLANSGDRMYIGSQEVQDGKKETLRIQLPTGFQNLQLSQNFIDFYTFVGETGVAFTMAIPPGEKPFELTYTLPANGPAFNVGRTLSVRTQTIEVAVLDTALEVESATLANSGMFEEQGRQYVHLSGQQFGIRSFVDMTIQAPQMPQAPQSTNETALPTSRFLFALVPLMLIPVIWVLVFVVRRNSSQRSSQAPVLETETLERLHKRRRLVWELAELDERFESGNVAKKEYRQQRRRLKDQAIALTRALK